MSVYKVKPFLGDGGSGGGSSEIVDALPASGKEGTTYLLRKTEGGVFKAHCYLPIGNESTNSTYVFVTDLTSDDFLNSIYKALGIDPNNLPEELHNNIPEFLEDINFYTQKEFDEEFNPETRIIVNTFEELPQRILFKDVLQDLGEVGIENFKVLEEVSVDEDTYWFIDLDFLNDFSQKTEIVNNIYTYSYRQIYYTGEEAQELFVGEWESQNPVPVQGYATDEILDRSELEENKYVIISMSPETSVYTYSYTQYVFDNGVYTEVSGASNGVNVVVITKFENNIFELDKTDDELIELFNSNNNGPIYIRNPEYNNYYGAMICDCGTYPDNPSNYFFKVISFDVVAGEGGGIRYYYENNQWKYELLE